MDIKFPLVESDINGFERVDIAGSAKQKLKNIILTNSGERVMLPNFGVGLKKYLFSNNANGNPVGTGQIDLRQNITRQVAQYAPEITIVSIDIVTNEQDYVMKVTVNYNVSGIFSDTLEIVA